MSARFGTWAPTKRGWVALALTGASFGFAMFTPTTTPALVSACLTAIVITSIFASLNSIRGLTIRRGSGEDGAVDRPFTLSYVITNQSPRSRQPAIVKEEAGFLNAGTLVSIVPPLGPMEKRVISRTCVPEVRGDFTLNGITLSGGDPAGLFRRSRTLDLPNHVLIRPASTPLAWLPLRVRHQVRISSTGRPIGVSGVGQEFFGVREYRPSDGFRFIHWKASAKQSRLMVREFEENSTKQIALLLDTHQPTPDKTDGTTDNLEFQVMIAHSLANYLAGTHSNLLFSTGSLEDDGLHLDAAASLHDRIVLHLSTLTSGQRTMADQIADSLELILPNSILYCLTLDDDQRIHELFDLLLGKGVDIRWIHAPKAAFESAIPITEAQEEVTPSIDRPVQPVLVGPTVNVEAILCHD